MRPHGPTHERCSSHLNSSGPKREPTSVIGSGRPRAFRVAISTALVFCLHNGPASAATAERPVLSLQFEEDWFAGADRYYTTGARIALTWPDRSTPDDQNLLYHLTPFLNHSFLTGRDTFSIGLATQFYTPDSVLASGVGPYERPYAGWLYLNFVALDQHAASTTTKADSEDLIEFQVGVVGPHAYSGDIQTWFHKRIINVPAFVGWPNQLKDELGLLLAVERRWRMTVRDAPWGIDFWPRLGGTLGNVRTQLQAGLVGRVGLNLPDSLELGQLPFTRAKSADARSWSIYALAGFEARAVARNIFLDGNTFVESARVDKRLLVHDAYWGIALQHGDFRLSYTFIGRSKEYFGQSGPQRYGVVALTLGL